MTLEELQAKQAERLEEIKAKHDAEVAEYHREMELRSMLPYQPDRVTFNSVASLGIQLRFKRGSVRELAEIVKAYSDLMVPTVEVRDGCLYRSPVELLKGGALKAYEAGKYEESAFCFTTGQGDGYGPDLEFMFFAKLEGGEILRIEVSLGKQVWQASARLDKGSEYQNIRPASASPNPVLAKLTKRYITWSPNRRGVDARYTYVIDYSFTLLKVLELLENSEISDWGSK
jgi:hypothetical protein